ncbi:hypothetical protein HZ326_29780 [Fusarium oxysporum f. sp. albedinis]|nr:hypothetical protein HZ326_29780 [Fusarium oxysporum f. sp. albedinis]
MTGGLPLVVDPFGKVCPPIWGYPFRSLSPRVLTGISRLEISSQGMSHSRSQITEPNHRQMESLGTIPNISGQSRRDNSTVHFPGGIRASEAQRPTTGRVSSESNHVDMRRDRVVEGILSGGPSLADSFPIARIDNGPNAAIHLNVILHSNL